VRSIGREKVWKAGSLAAWHGFELFAADGYNVHSVEYN
jgi:hypothetical protein